MDDMGLTLVLGVVGVVFFVFMVVLEALLLWWQGWGALKIAGRDALIANVVSSGPALGWMWFGSGADVLGLLAAWAMSVVIEGMVLLVIRRAETTLVWRASAIINTVTFGALLVMTMLTFWASA